jgi:hypothetical protein
MTCCTSWPCRISQRSEFAACIARSMSLWVGCQATLHSSCVRPPRLVTHESNWAKGLGTFRYRHQWFDRTYLCHIWPLHGKMVFQDCLSYVLL